MDFMHAIQPARLKPGAAIPPPDTGRSAGDVAARQHEAARPIRGRALIFWDPKSLPGTKFARKLDAIDTDQITPAADCVSESLDTLEERWKAGSFRYLMPDFRARVHRGETFVIAGDRFAIGCALRILKRIRLELTPLSVRCPARSAPDLPRSR